MRIIKSEELNKNKITKVVNKDYSDKIIDGDFEMPISINPNKPTGFWLSINSGWENWCKSEMPEWLVETDILEIELNNNHNVMLIDNVDDIICVWKEYIKESGFDSSFPEGDSFMCFFNDKMEKCDFWGWLKDKYKLSGIYLNDNGQCRTRLTTMLYGWDCESCVIFDKNIIKKMVKKNDKL